MHIASPPCKGSILGRSTSAIHLRSPLGSRNDTGKAERIAPIAAMAPTDAGDVVERVRDMILQQDDASAYAAHSSQLSGIISLVQSAMHDSGSLYDKIGSGDASMSLDLLHQAGHGLASLPSSALSPELMAAAQQGLSDAASWADSAIAAVSLAGPHVTSLHSLAVLAYDRLSALQDIDPDSYAVMKNSMDSVLGALKDLMGNEAGKSADHWTTALVLGVQQLVAASRLEESGGAYSLEAMAEAQKAFEDASKATPIGLEGLVTLTMGIISLILVCIPRGDLSSAISSQEEAPAQYNISDLTEYWSKRPILVMQRSSQLIGTLSIFLVNLLVDAKTGQWEAKMPARAQELRKIIEELGVTCIKIAQAFSTRVDMLPQIYLDEFCRLQDNVPTFSTSDARFVLENGLGRPVDTVFDWLSEDPIAAASIGQVYRGKLRSEYGGAEVAVKVQRPGVLESASLDVFLLRRIAVLMSKIPGMSDQWAMALDDWALRFFQEMDYGVEAHNTMMVKQQMASMSGIVIPTVYAELVSRKVMVTEWVDGDKLSNCKPSEIKALCGTFLNCFLVQLMETGLLHADPHPGNLMRTHDGKLVILDFGLMTEIKPEHRIALVEFITHLSMDDWDSIMDDLVTLGFMPNGMSEEARVHIQPVMKEMLGSMFGGGGLGKSGLNFGNIALQLQGVSMNYQLCIPPYFTNIMRSFSTIEGIALKVDPSYSMVQECMPYLSRRLLTDNNPKMRAALRLMLYGKGQRLDIERLQKLTSTFGNFSTGVTSTQSASSPVFSNEERIKGSAPSFNSSLDSPVLSDTMREALKVVFAKDGSYAQELIVDELVAAVDAMSRQGLSEALKLVLGSATAVSALRHVEALGPLRTMLMPIPLPIDMLHSMEPAVQLSKEDRQALNTLSAVLDLIGGGNGSTGKSATGIISSATMRMMQGGVPNVASMASMGGKAVRAAGEVAPLLPELLPGIQVTAELFTRQLVRRMAIRLAEDLGEPKSGHQHHSHQSPTKAPSPKPKNAQDAKGWARRAPY